MKHIILMGPIKWGERAGFGIAYQNKKSVAINHSQRNIVDPPEDINMIFCDYFKVSICREQIWKSEFLLVFLM